MYWSKPVLTKHIWIVQRHGAFALFHDNFCWNPSIYLGRCIFKWEDLINEEQQRINQYSLILNMKNCNLVFDERKSKNIKYLESEFTREFIF